VLTGTNLGDQGADQGLDPLEAFADLLEGIFSSTALERLRVSSLDPAEISPRLLGIMAREPRFCPHFHVSLQAMHPKILRLMKRKYGVETAEIRLREIAALETSTRLRPFVGMDLITGFPGETEADFEESYARLESLPWSRLHVFPYSERAGTPATRLPGTVLPQERVRRARKLAALSMRRMEEHYGQPRRLDGILLEKPVRRAPVGLRDENPSDTLWVSGYTPDYLKVWIPVKEGEAGALRNRLVSVVATQLLRDPAAGEVSWLASIV
jgi:tRNA A37 methylthiotransferase MiaB